MNSSDCKRCGATFLVIPAEERCRSKASPKLNDTTHLIPPPTLCPECRNIRRMAWRNDRSFYIRKCDLSGERFVSIYPADAPFPVYKPSAWYSDGWNSLDYAQELDLSRPFFEQWHELFLKVPRLGIDIVNCENSDYCNYCGDDKDCYLDIAGEGNEECFYNLFTKFSTNCVDCTFVYSSTLCYECLNSYNAYDCSYSIYLEDCSNCNFCYDLKGCNDCLFSYNLRNKQYYIYNKPYSKEEYEKKLAELSDPAVTSQEWYAYRLQHAIYRDMYTLNCESCSGNNIKNSKNCQYVYNTTNSEDCAYLYDVLDATDCCDLNYSLYKPECSLELISTLQMQFSAFNMASHYCARSFYCDLTNNSQDLFGCIGLNHKRFCILNKQYSESEYNILVAQLIEAMTARGEWGEFFPMELAPSAYNETVAQEYFPISKEQALTAGLKWKEDEPTKQGSGGSDLPTCNICQKQFKIIEPEHSFYRKKGLPIPKSCPQCRHQQRMGLRTPRKLWERTCSKCNAPTYSPFNPELPEQVYCEGCYLGVVR